MECGERIAQVQSKICKNMKYPRITQLRHERLWCRAVGITGYEEVRGLNEGKQSTILRLKRAWRELGKLVLIITEFMTVVNNMLH